MDIEDAFDKTLDRLVEVIKDSGELSERLIYKEKEISQFKVQLDEMNKRRQAVVETVAPLKIAFGTLWRAAKAVGDGRDGRISELLTVVAETASMVPTADDDDLPF